MIEATAASVSVIVPVHGRAQFLEAALRSIAWQSVPPLEVIVVDDRAEHGVTARAKHALPSVQIVRAARPGVGSARNTGLSHASGTLVAHLDADDVWLPDFLAATSSALATQPECVLASTRFVEFGDEGRRVSRPLARPHPDDHALRRLLLQVQPPPSTTLIRHDALRMVGGWPEGVFFEDRLLWARLARVGQLAFVDRPLALYRRHAANMTSTGPMADPGRWMRDYRLGDQVAVAHRPDDVALRTDLDFNARVVAAQWSTRGGRRGHALRAVLRVLVARPTSRQALFLALSAVIPPVGVAWLRRRGSPSTDPDVEAVIRAS